MTNRETLRVLALEPYYGGSHAAFLDGLSGGSAHSWTLLTNKAYDWKWRMRHASVTMAESAARLDAAGERFDLLFASSMVNLAEFRGLAPRRLANLPAVLYFHENQLTYPDPNRDERDVHFGLSQMVAARSADAVWFNSEYHRQEFLDALADLVAVLPKPSLAPTVEAITARSSVVVPGVTLPAFAPQRCAGPLHIVWPHRWEHDKCPEILFDALERLVDRGVAFVVSVLGEQFRRVPDCFDRARSILGDRVCQWGRLEDRAAYEQCLATGDVAVSTARHEFFGLAMVEAAAAGAVPLVPDALAYPDVFGRRDGAPGVWFHDGSSEGVAGRLEAWAQAGGPRPAQRAEARRHVERFGWPVRCEAVDQALRTVVSDVARASRP